MEKKWYRPIAINPCLNGFVVTIGCQTAVFVNNQDMVDAFKCYLEDPHGVEKRWLENSLCQNAPQPTADIPDMSETVRPREERQGRRA